VTRKPPDCSTTPMTPMTGAWSLFPRRRPDSVTTARL
jgi:hypothetical protein